MGVITDIIRAPDGLYLNDSEKENQRNIIRSIKAKVFASSSYKLQELRKAMIMLEDDIRDLRSKANEVNHRISEKLIIVDKMKNDSLKL